MKAIYTDAILVQVTKTELELLKAGAILQQDYASNMREYSISPQTWDDWNDQVKAYRKLVDELAEIINTMPF